VNRKQGAPNYGSDGASAEIEITLDDELPLQAVCDVMPIWYKALEQSVTAELARQAAGRLSGPAEPPARHSEPVRPDPAPQPQPQPRREYPTGHTTGTNPRPYVGRPDVPEDGRQLLGWARRLNRNEEMIALGKSWRLPSRVIEWTAGEVADVFQTLTSADGPPRNGHSRNGNGAAY
jgi:hypothetical protein